MDCAGQEFNESTIRVRIHGTTKDVYKGKAKDIDRALLDRRLMVTSCDKQDRAIFYVE
jgi:hypothetical protein